MSDANLTAAERRALGLIKIASEGGELPADPRRKASWPGHGVAWPNRPMIERLIDTGMVAEEYRTIEGCGDKFYLVQWLTPAGAAVLEG